MSKKIKIVIVAVTVAAIMTLFVGITVAAAGPSDKGNGICCGHGASFGGQTNNMDAICGLLGITEDELQAQRQEGKSIVQIATERGISQEQLVEAIMIQREAEIQAKIESGVLIQERAAIMQQQMEQNIIRSINRTTVGQPEWAGANGGGYNAGNGITGSGNLYRRGSCSK